MLYLYLTSSEVVSSIFIRKDENRIQLSIYYISKVLYNVKTKYSKMEKMIYALIIPTQHLRPYFQAHSMIVLTYQSLKAILHRSDTSDRMAKWAIKLSKFDIQYRP